MISPAVSIALGTRQGTIVGAAVPIPPGAATVTAQAAMIDADILADGAGQRTMHLGLRYSYDGGRSYGENPEAEESWTSGPDNVVMGGTQADQPSIQASVPTAPMPSHALAYVSLPAETNIGVTLIFADSNGTEL